MISFSKLLTRFTNKAVPHTAIISEQPVAPKHTILLGSYTYSGVSWLQNCFIEANIRLDGIPSAFFRFKRHYDEHHDEYEVTGNLGVKVYLPSLTFKDKFIFRNDYFVWSLAHDIPTLEQAKNHKVIIVVRDPRDALWSRYHGLSTDQDFYSYIKFYAASWTQFYASCIHLPNVYFVRFEDIKDNPKQALENIMKFCEIDVEPRMIDIAIANSTSERSRAAEQLYKTYTPLPEQQFVTSVNRSGLPRQWQGLAAEEKAFALVKEANKAIMETFDYS